MTPEEKCVEAAVAVIAAANPQTFPVANIYRFFENTEGEDGSSIEKQQKPCVIVQFIPSEEAFPQSGIIVGDLVVTCVSNAARTTHAEYGDMKGEVFNAIYTPTLPAQLTTQGTYFHCYGFAGAVSLNHRVSGEDWESSISIPLSVFGADVS